MTEIEEVVAKAPELALLAIRDSLHHICERGQSRFPNNQLKPSCHKSYCVNLGSDMGFDAIEYHSAHCSIVLIHKWLGIPLRHRKLLVIEPGEYDGRDFTVGAKEIICHVLDPDPLFLDIARKEVRKCAEDLQIGTLRLFKTAPTGQ